MYDDLPTEFPGYRILPSPHLPVPGYGTLEIYISARPVERFFDTQRAVFPLTEGGLFRKLIINHPWINDGVRNPCHICAGRFYLYERDGDEQSGFSLGGELEISQDDDWVICRLTSPAPILDLSPEPYSGESWLAEKFEGLLARRWATYGDDDTLFASRLETVDPFDLFIACLSTMQNEYRNMPAASRSSIQEQYNTVNHWVHLLEVAGEWPSMQPPLEDLL
jgi:hypothetical protein